MHVFTPCRTKSNDANPCLLCDPAFFTELPIAGWGLHSTGQGQARHVSCQFRGCITLDDVVVCYVAFVRLNNLRGMLIKGQQGQARARGLADRGAGEVHPGERAIQHAIRTLMKQFFQRVHRHICPQAHKHL